MFKKLLIKLELKIRKIKFNRSIKRATKSFNKCAKATINFRNSMKKFGEVLGVKYE